MLLIRGAKQLLTLRGTRNARRGAALSELGIITDGAILIREGRIQDIGPSRRIENLAAARRAHDVIEASGRVVMPGFVDSHTHLVFGQPALDEFEGRMRRSAPEHFVAHVETAVRASQSVRRLELRARAQAERMIRHGTTSVEVKSGFGLDEAAEIKILRAVAALHGDPMDAYGTFLAGRIMPLAYRDDPAGYIDYLCGELLPLLRRRRLAVFADIVCEEGLFSLAQIRRYLECARSFEYPVRLHLEGPSTAGAVQVACEAGATSVDHADYLSEDEISMLGAANTMATLIPGATFYRGGSRYPPARALIEAGAAVALASGFSPDSSPTGSMQMAVAIACSQMRMTPAEAISAATINGAHALGIAGRTGSLEPEKQADLLIMNASDYREVPFYFGVNQVYITMKRGEAVYVENEVTGLHGL